MRLGIGRPLGNVPHNLRLEFIHLGTREQTTHDNKAPRFYSLPHTFQDSRVGEWGSALHIPGAVVLLPPYIVLGWEVTHQRCHRPKSCQLA
jgi:hypothetical protein